MSKIDIKRKLSTALELPKDVTLGLPTISITGDEEVIVTNHKGILEYTGGVVRLSTILGGIRVLGTNLILKEMTAEIVVITGKINTVGWEVG